jgi:hypothetical protein
MRIAARASSKDSEVARDRSYPSWLPDQAGGNISAMIDSTEPYGRYHPYFTSCSALTPNQDAGQLWSKLCQISFRTQHSLCGRMNVGEQYGPWSLVGVNALG